MIGDEEFGELPPDPDDSDQFRSLIDQHIDNIANGRGCPGPGVAHGIVVGSTFDVPV